MARAGRTRLLSSEERTWLLYYKLGYLPELNILSDVEPDGPNWTALADPQKRFRFCANWELNACN
jgi:hypothetical protein